MICWLLQSHNKSKCGVQKQIVQVILNVKNSKGNCGEEKGCQGENDKTNWDQCKTTESYDPRTVVSEVVYCQVNGVQLEKDYKVDCQLGKWSATTV